MPIQRHDIYLVRLPLGKSFDHRPCVVLEPPRNDSTLVILASASDLYRPQYDFKIPKEHPDFPKTGLTKTTYVVGDKILTVPSILLQTLLGRLEGALAQAFDQWID